MKTNLGCLVNLPPQPTSPPPTTIHHYTLRNNTNKQQDGQRQHSLQEQTTTTLHIQYETNGTSRNQLQTTYLLHLHWAYHMHFTRRTTPTCLCGLLITNYILTGCYATKLPKNPLAGSRLSLYLILSTPHRAPLTSVSGQ